MFANQTPEVQNKLVDQAAASADQAIRSTQRVANEALRRPGRQRAEPARAGRADGRPRLRNAPARWPITAWTPCASAATS